MQYLPAGFVQDAFADVRPTSVVLKDFANDEYPCSLKWVVNDDHPPVAYLRGGNWKIFVKDNGFTSGTRILLCVDKTNPCVIHGK